MSFFSDFALLLLREGPNVLELGQKCQAKSLSSADGFEMFQNIVHIHSVRFPAINITYLMYTAQSVLRKVIYCYR